jgi:uncharacterized SAM-binding protein YcdF (DUF218 family)
MYEVVSGLFRPYTLLWLLVLAALIYCWTTQREKRRRLLVVTIPLVALQFFSTPIVAHLALGSLEWQYPPLESRPADCQAIVVLASGTYAADEVRDRPVLADDTRLRCIYAAALYRQGQPCPVLVSGGKVHADDPDPACAHVMARFLQNERVAATDLVIEDGSRTTYENAVEASRLLRRCGLSKVLLVVDAVDMYRAVCCFRRQGIEVTAAPSYYRAKPLTFRPMMLLPNASAVRNSEHVGHEWLGVAWYWCCGRI